MTATDKELDAVLALIAEMEAAKAQAAQPNLERREAPPASRLYSFQRSGNVWRVVFGGAEFHLDDTLGARYLHYFLHHPNEPISAFDLEVAVTPEKGRARDRQTIQLGLDADAVRSYLRELDCLRAELQEAETAGNFGEAQRLANDIATIEAELKAGTRSVDTGERARQNVCKRVMAVRKRLQQGNRAERDFAAHLDAHLTLGFEGLYNQPEGRLWT